MVDEFNIKKLGLQTYSSTSHKLFRLQSATWLFDTNS